MPNESVTICTVGHSRRTLADLLRLLQEADVNCLVDLRAMPTSQRHPQFSQHTLRGALEAVNIVYHWAGRLLGGFRRGRPDSRHTAIADAGLRAFADHMESEAFRRGVTQLLSLAQQTRAAILCAEKLPQDCHRALIADYLIANGTRVRHLIELGVAHDHHLTASVRIEGNALIYDRKTQRPLRLES